jgi:metal-responsive CopG/Arc/MetJ family transcriptional regulator
MGRKKGQSKEKVGFSIDKDINELLDDYCQYNMINKSKLVNKLIKDYLIKKGEEIHGKADYMDN